MANSMKIMMVLLILAGTFTTARSADSVKMVTVCKFVAEKDNFYRVLYQSAKRENVKIQLYDNRDQVIYEEVLKSLSFSKRYDLGNLPGGEYLMKVSSPSISYEEDLILGDVSGFKFYLNPIKETKEVSLVGSHPRGDSMTLFILDDSNEIIYREEFQETKQVHKYYDFSKLYSEKVSFVLYHGEQLITEQKFEF